VRYGNLNKLQKYCHAIIFGYAACGWAMRKSEWGQTNLRFQKGVPLCLKRAVTCFEISFQIVIKWHINEIKAERT
jgi:hypothetical protein